MMIPRQDCLRCPFDQRKLGWLLGCVMEGGLNLKRICTGYLGHGLKKVSVVQKWKLCLNNKASKDGVEMPAVYNTFLISVGVPGCMPDSLRGYLRGRQTKAKVPEYACNCMGQHDRDIQKWRLGNGSNSKAGIVSWCSKCRQASSCPLDCNQAGHSYDHQILTSAKGSRTHQGK
jgi:hypothetical protein